MSGCSLLARAAVPAGPAVAQVEDQGEQPSLAWNDLLALRLRSGREPAGGPLAEPGGGHQEMQWACRGVAPMTHPVFTTGFPLAYDQGRGQG